MPVYLAPRQVGSPEPKRPVVVHCVVDVAEDSEVKVDKRGVDVGLAERSLLAADNVVPRSVVEDLFDHRVAILGEDDRVGKGKARKLGLAPFKVVGGHHKNYLQLKQYCIQIFAPQ
jgi:hypothetical protein